MPKLWTVLALVALLSTAAVRVALADSPAESEQLGAITRTVFSSSVRNGTLNSPDQVLINYPGVKCVVDVTNVDTTVGITPIIQGKDDLSGKYYELLTGAKQTTTSTQVLTVRPNITSTLNKASSDGMPGHWRFRVLADNLKDVEYSVGCVYLP